MGRPATYDRVEIIDKAMALFWRRGYHATSLKDLEAALDMRPGSIYAAFGSKEGLFREAMARYVAVNRAAFQETMRAAGSPLSGLATHVRRLGCVNRETAPSSACMLVKTVLETADDDPTLRQEAEAAMRDVEADFAAAFRAAQAAGELAPGAAPERLAARLQAAIFGLRAFAQRTDAADRAAALAEDLASDLEALRPPPVTTR